MDFQRFVLITFMSTSFICQLFWSWSHCPSPFCVSFPIVWLQTLVYEPLTKCDNTIVDMTWPRVWRHRQPSENYYEQKQTMFSTIFYLPILIWFRYHLNIKQSHMLLLTIKTFCNFWFKLFLFRVCWKSTYNSEKKSVIVYWWVE